MILLRIENIEGILLVNKNEKTKISREKLYEK